MSRRKFLKDTALVVGTPLVAAAATRLYGTPASIDPNAYPDVTKFQLPLSRGGVPSGLWTNLGRVADLWDKVLGDANEAAAFYASPATYMTSIGLDGSDTTLLHESVVMLQQMASPDVKQCWQTG